MEEAIERAYKRKCFQGRGTAARLLDRAFFSALSGACLFIVLGRLLLSVLLSGAVFLLLSLLSRRRWDRFRRQLWNSVAMELKRENWLKQEAERIRRQGGVILFPLPKEEEFMGLCLRSGPGTAFHTFGEPDKEWMAQAAGLGCSMTFHPWGVGETPNREQIEDRIRQKSPQRRGRLMKRILQLPDNRYLLTGCALLLLSIFLKGALYWRLLSSLCLLIGAFRRSLHMVKET